MQISRIDVWPSPHTRNTPTPPQSVVPAACDPLGVPDLRDLLTLHAAAAGIVFRSIGTRAIAGSQTRWTQSQHR